MNHFVDLMTFYSLDYDHIQLPFLLPSEVFFQFQQRMEQIDRIRTVC